MLQVAERETVQMKSSVGRFASFAAQGCGLLVAIVVLLLSRHPTSALAWVAYVLALAFAPGCRRGMRGQV
jgi:hypothetical protein